VSVHPGGVCRIKLAPLPRHRKVGVHGRFNATNKEDVMYEDLIYKEAFQGKTFGTSEHRRTAFSPDD
ncbi:hypothetical protein CYMTET_36736, partial [Cymbomonas tetramitiformis]